MSEDFTVTARQPTKRIKALDIIRGYFLIVILINHIELYPSFFDFFTGRGRLLVSAAEGFFFMSGLLVGMVYKRRLHLGTAFVFKKMWRRAAELYVGSVIFTLLFTWLAIKLNHPNIKDVLPSPFHWHSIIGQTLLMRFGYGWADFLDRFAILMFLAPFGFYLLAKGRWYLLLVASLITWCLRGENFTLSWQLLFGGAMMIGFYWNEIGSAYHRLSAATRKRLNRALIVFSSVTFLLSYSSVFILSKLNQNLLGAPWLLPHWLQTVTLKWNSANEFVWLYAQKWTLGPVRIILFLAWFWVLFMFVRRYESQINKWTGGLVEMLGKNSLFVYILHAFIVFGFKLLIPRNTNIFENFGITALALACLIAITYYYRGPGKGSFINLGKRSKSFNTRGDSKTATSTSG